MTGNYRGSIYKSSNLNFDLTNKHLPFFITSGGMNVIPPIKELEKT